MILGRNMKKDRKYFLENLSCGILRIKHDNNIETVRGLKIIEDAHGNNIETVQGLKMVEDAEKALKRGQCIHGTYEGMCY